MTTTLEYSFLSIFLSRLTGLSQSGRKEEAESRTAKDSKRIDFSVADVRYFAITLVLLVFSLIIALATDDLGMVMAIIGATGSTLLGYIIPGYVYVSIFDKNGNFKVPVPGLSDVTEDYHTKKLSGINNAGEGYDSKALPSSSIEGGSGIDTPLLCVRKSEPSLWPTNEGIMYYMAWFQLILGCVIMCTALTFLFLV